MQGIQQELATHTVRADEEMGRLPWPAAALTIVALSLGGWAVVALLARLFLG